jgi:hypothetical protein
MCFGVGMSSFCLKEEEEEERRRRRTHAQLKGVSSNIVIIKVYL